MTVHSSHGALALDDPRWKQLTTRDGDGGWVPEWLRTLAEDPADAERFAERWPSLVSEGTSWPAAVAAFPHLVELAGRVDPGARIDYVTVLGLIVKDWEPAPWQKEVEAILPGFNFNPDAETIIEARRLTAEVAALAHEDERDLRYVLTALAALGGRTALAEVIDTLDEEETCPPYAEHVWGSDEEGTEAEGTDKKGTNE